MSANEFVRLNGEWVPVGEGTVPQMEPPLIEDGLQAYYPIDTDSLVDASGNGNDGRHRSGYTTGQPGVRNNAVEYHTNDNPWSKLPHPISGEVTWSISLWFKQRQGGIDENHALIGNYALSSDREARIATWIRDDATLNVLVANQPKQELDSSRPFAESNRLMIRGVGDIVEDQWHHMVVSTTEEELRLYLDGDLLATSADEPETADQAFDNEGAGEPLLADRNILTLSTTFWGTAGWGDGWMDEVYIFDRALTDAEAQLLYNADAPG